MEVEGLTPKQKIVFAAVRELQSLNGRVPTLEEVRRHLNYATVSSVQRHMDALKRKGYVHAEKHASRAIRITHQHIVNIPLVGNVACGAPLLAEENVEAYVAYDADSLRGNPKEYFFLRAVGDSMNQAGIDNGDLVLVKQQQTADAGKNIVALVGDDATIKRLSMENGHWTLEPMSDNPVHKKLIMVEDFAIQGVAVDVVKTGGIKADGVRGHA